MTATPSPSLTVLTLGVGEMARAARFYTALGFPRRMAGTGEEVAFFQAGGVVLALYPTDKLAAEAGLSPPAGAGGFQAATLAWNCNTREEVDAAFDHALAAGATPLKAPADTHYGGYAGYFADPDGHVWEIVTAPGIVVSGDGRVSLPD